MLGEECNGFGHLLSLIDVYKDMVTCDKLIFPSAITRILRDAFISYPKSTHFSIMCAIDAMTVRRSEALLRPKRPWTKATAPSNSSIPSSSTGGVTL